MEYWLWVVTTFLVAFLIYYIVFCISTPALEFHGNHKWFQGLVESCPSLLKPYYPTLWAVNGHFHSFLFAAWPGFSGIIHGGKTLVQWVELSDGGQVALEWDTKPIGDTEIAKDNPILVIIPGVCGEPANPYVTKLRVTARALGFRCVSKSWRGINIPLKTDMPETWSDRAVDDLSECLQSIRKDYPKSPFFAVGYSFGGAFLKMYSGSKRSEKSPQFEAVFSICGLWQWEGLANHLETCKMPYNLLNTVNLRRLMNSNKNYQFITSKNKDVSHSEILQATGQRSYNKALTIKYTGHNSVEEYYQEMDDAISLSMKHCRVPCVAFVAEDDPLIPPHAVPWDKVKVADNVMLVKTKSGGHCGYLGSSNPIFNLGGGSWLTHTLSEMLIYAFSTYKSGQKKK